MDNLRTRLYIHRNKQDIENIYSSYFGDINYEALFWKSRRTIKSVKEQMQLFRIKKWSNKNLSMTSIYNRVFKTFYSIEY